MRETSALAPSRGWRWFLQLLAERLRRSLAGIANASRNRAQSEGADENEFAWLEAYKAALLEFNEERASVAISTAMQAIERRENLIRFSRRNAQERELLEHAASTLMAIKEHRTVPAANEIKSA